MKNTPDSSRMDMYRRQMMEMFQNAAPSPISPQEDNWLDDRYPEPDIQRDKAVLTTPAEMPAEPTPTPIPSVSPIPTPSPSFVGYLRVFAFSGGGAEPISGARVIITQPEGDAQNIYANLITDRDGFTPVVALPSVDPALTLQPGSTKPYETYTVRVTADGFRPVEHRNVPVYGNNYVTQPAAMIPLLPGGEENDTQEFFSGGPENL